ncbi:MAG: hypothetical protein BWK76_08260 [Desulfobulbaceae bacterium A2]|nr:MAG: hypothetical protein BWK76_08260 [Desulfobulbaceae bacterium A2]
MHRHDSIPHTAAPIATASSTGYIKWIALSVTLINIFAIMVGVLYVRSSRYQYEQKSSIIAQSIAQILEKTIAFELDKIHLVMLTVKDAFENEHAHDPIDAQRLNAFLAHQKARLPITARLLIADEQGLVKYGIGGDSAPAITINDREYYIKSRDIRDAGLCIGEPVFSRLIKTWVLPLALRLNKADGSFAGVVFATIEITHFAKIFSVVDIGQHGGISLRDKEMGIIARYPSPPDVASIIGNKTLSPELKKLFNEGNSAGTFFTPTSWDNVAKVVSYRKISEYPLYVNVGIAAKDYLADWRKESAILIGIALVFFTLTFFSALITYRYITVLRKTSIALAKAHEKLEEKVKMRTLQLDSANISLKEGHSRLITVLNSIDAIVYVTDMETYEILFINDYVKNLFGDITGKKCWQTMQRDQDGPCSFCTNNTLVGQDNIPTGVHQAEYFNTITGRWYEGHDRAILWIDGSLKRMQIATDITERKQAEEDKEKLIASLREALDKVKQLSGMLPICSVCKKIRDDTGYWTQLEAYIHTHSEAEFSHSICPECARKLYPEYCDAPHDEEHNDTG